MVGCSDFENIPKKERMMLKKSCLLLYESYIRVLDNLILQIKDGKIRKSSCERIVKYIENQMKSNRVCNCLLPNTKIKMLKNKIKNVKIELKKIDKRR